MKTVSANIHTHTHTHGILMHVTYGMFVFLGLIIIFTKQSVDYLSFKIFSTFISLYLVL